MPGSATKHYVTRTLGVLTLLCSTGSLVNFTRSVTDLGLLPVLAGVFDYYRAAFSAIIEPLIELLRLPRPPEFYFDLWPLSMVGAGAHVLAFSQVDEAEVEGQSGAWLWRLFFKNRVLRPVMVVFEGLVLVGLLVLVVSLLLGPFVRWVEPDDDFSPEVRAAAIRMRNLLLASLVLSVLFFALSGFSVSAPSVG